MVLFRPKFMTNAMILILTLLISHFWMATFLVSFLMVFTILNKNSFVSVEILRPSQHNRVMSSAVSLPNHILLGRLSPLSR